MTKLRFYLSGGTLIASMCALLVGPSVMTAQTAPITHEEAHRRAETLLKQMTVEEKVGADEPGCGHRDPRTGRLKSPMTLSPRARSARCCGSSM